MNYDNLPTDDLKEFGIIGADRAMQGNEVNFTLNFN